MKITDIAITKETVDDTDILRCLITLDDGQQKQCVVPWRNEMGLWASPNAGREPAEIAAYLRCFARAIEEDCKIAA